MKRKSTLVGYGLIIVTFLFGSCKSFTNLSIEKRQHRGGYYVDWGNGKVKTDPAKSASAGGKHKQDPQKKTADVPAPESAQANAATMKPAGLPAVNKEEKQETRGESYSHNSFKVSEEPVAMREKAATKIMNAIPYANNDSYKSGTASTPQWVLVILCIFIPPLAIYLSEDIGNPFWIDLVLYLLGLGLLSSGLFGLFWLAAIVYAFVVIF